MFSQPPTRIQIAHHRPKRPFETIHTADISELSEAGVPKLSPLGLHAPSCQFRLLAMFPGRKGSMAQLVGASELFDFGGPWILLGPSWGSMVFVSESPLKRCIKWRQFKV